jgi:hypothetical protein
MQKGGCQCLNGGRMRIHLMGTKSQFGTMKASWRWTALMVAHNVNILNAIVHKIGKFYVYFNKIFLKPCDLLDSVPLPNS